MACGDHESSDRSLASLLGPARVRLALAFAFTLIASGALAQVAPKPGVLVIHSNPRATPAAVTIEEALRAGIAESYKNPVEMYSEYLDDEWASVKAYGPEQADFLRRKYGNRNVRVIVASAMTALDFASNFRDKMFPGVPVVHIAIPEESLEERKLPPDFVGRTVNLDPTPTLRLALRMHPGTHRLVVVVGATERDRVWLARIRAAVARLGTGIDVEYLAGLTTAENQRRLAALTPGTLVYTAGYFADGAGQLGVPRRAAEILAAASAVPVYGPYDTFIGTGVVGGYVTPFDQQAKDAAGVVGGLLGGSAPSQFATASNAQVPIVDWRVLRRWRVDEARLPPDTIVKFREPTLWERYSAAISITVVIVLVQAALIGALLLQRFRRRRAEESSLALAGRLLTAQEDERRRLARDLHDDVTQRLARLADRRGTHGTRRRQRARRRPARAVREELVRLSEDVHGLSYQLHPSVLDDLGLVEGLQGGVRARFAPGAHSDVSVDIDEVPAKLPHERCRCAFSASRRRRCATWSAMRRPSSIGLSLVRDGRGLQLVVRDDGDGFDAQNQSSHRPSLGPVSMRERVRQVGGRLRVDSAPGNGTTVTAWVPLDRSRGMKRPRVLLADDHLLVAEALKALLIEEFDLVGVVEDGRAMVKAARELQPDVIVADISMPHLNGLDALPQVKAAAPAAHVVFLTMHRDVAYARRALEAGASGFVLKHSAPAELILADRDPRCRGAHSSRPRSPAEVIDIDQGESGRCADPVASLSARQREILPHAGRGHVRQADRGSARHLAPHRRVPQVPGDGRRSASRATPSSSISPSSTASSRRFRRARLVVLRGFGRAGSSLNLRASTIRSAVLRAPHNGQAPMADLTGSCVLLADRHHGLSEGVRGLLETTFESVFMVGDEPSLLEGAQRLAACARDRRSRARQGDAPGLLASVSGTLAAVAKVVVLTVHDEPSVADAALRAGAHGVVLKRAIATDLLAAIDEVREGRQYVSPGLHRKESRPFAS